jgi:hypothetical protein
LDSSQEPGPGSSPGRVRKLLPNFTNSLLLFHTKTQVNLNLMPIVLKINKKMKIFKIRLTNPRLNGTTTRPSITEHNRKGQCVNIVSRESWPEHLNKYFAYSAGTHTASSRNKNAASNCEARRADWLFEYCICLCRFWSLQIPRIRNCAVGKRKVQVLHSHRGKIMSKTKLNNNNFWYH